MRGSKKSGGPKAAAPRWHYFCSRYVARKNGRMGWRASVQME